MPHKNARKDAHKAHAQGSGVPFVVDIINLTRGGNTRCHGKHPVPPTTYYQFKQGTRIKSRVGACGAMIMTNGTMGLMMMMIRMMVS